MDVKQAVAQAKEYVRDLFAEEKPANVGLEEVEFDDRDGEWRITIGFTRPWNKPQFRNKMSELLEPSQFDRSYKVVCISDKTGAVKSLKNHEVEH